MSGYDVEPSELRAAAEQLRAATDGVKADLASAGAGVDVGHPGLAEALAALCRRSDTATTAGVVSLDLAATALDSTASSYAEGDAETAHTFKGKERKPELEESRGFGSASSDGAGGADGDG